MYKSQKATDLQKGIAYHCEMTNDSSLYITQVEIKFDHQIDVNLLNSAWNKTCLNCCWLRASLKKGEEFTFAENITQQTKYYDLSEKNHPIKRYEQAKRDDLSEGISLDSQLLHRLSLFKLGDQDFCILWTHHHILFDASSFIKIINLWLNYYLQFVDKEKSLSKNDLPFHTSPMEVVKLDSAYWQGLLQGITGSQPLYIRAGQVSDAGIGRKNFQIEAQITKALEELAQANSATINTILQAAWGLVQAQYQNKENIVFGSVRAFPKSLIKESVGLFINTLPVKVSIDKHITFSEYLSDIRQQHQKIREQAACSLAEIYACSELQGAETLFDVAFDFKSFASNELLSREVVKKLKVEVSFLVNTHYPLMFELTHYEGGILGKVSYAASLYSEIGVEQLLESYHLVLKQLASRKDLTLKQIYLVTDQDYFIQINKWNNTSKNFPNEDYLYSAIERNAIIYGEKLAVVSARGNITYAQLNKKANQIAYYLRKQGVVANKLVAIVMEKGWEQVVASVAIMKAGGAYLPINADFPESRIHQLLAQGEVQIVLTQSNYVDAICWPEGIIYAAVDHSPWEKFPDTNLSPIQTLGDLAYVIFTSGSTGIPKGVMIDHCGAINTINDINTRFHVTEKDVMLGLSTLNFDLSVYDIFGVLGAGGLLVLPPEVDRKDPMTWLSLIERYQVTLWDSVPALMQMLTEYCLSEEKKDSTRFCQKIRLVLMSGDWIPLDMPSKIWQLCGQDTQLISLGGATEGSIWSILYPIEAVNPEWRSVPYGKPMWNQKIYILNKHQELQPIGVPGELYIGGVGVAKGYWKDEERTKKSFINHPEFGYLYRAGDMGRYREDGAIEFMGRLDHQVKIRGYRIELGEIEYILKQISGIKDVVVRIQETHNNQFLVAYFVSTKDFKFTEENFKVYSHQKLPEYMVPTAYIKLEQFPLSSNGKIDHKALPILNFSKSGDYRKQGAENKLQENLIVIWKKLLAIETLGINENFFTLGGHSLTALQLLTKIREDLNNNISIKHIFLYPTIKELAAYIETLVDPSPVVSVNSENSITSAVALPSQQRIWFLSQLVSDKPLYNITFCKKIHGILDIGHLKSAFNQLLVKHSVLRTAFNKVNDELVKKVYEEVAFELSVVKTEINTENLRLLINEQNNKLFDFSLPPLFRVSLVESEKESAIIITVHHIIFDARSIDIFISELNHFYNNTLESNLSIEMMDFKRKAINIEGILYFKKLLTQNPTIFYLPFMKKRPDFFSYMGETYYFELPRRLVFQLRKISKTYNITLPNLFLTALYVLLKKYGQKDGYCIGMPVTLRDNVQLNKKIGCFLNILLVKMIASTDDTVIKTAKNFQNQWLESFEFKDTPYEKLIEELNIERDPSHNALFQTMFSYQQSGFDQSTFAGYPMVDHPVLYKTAKFDVTTFIFDYAVDNIGIAFEYCTDLFDQWMIKQMADHYAEILGNIARSPSADLNNMSASSIEDARYQSLKGHNHSKSLSNTRNLMNNKNSFENRHTSTEKKIINIFSRILDVQTVTVQDNFFGLGGHSMLATKIILEIERLCSIKIPLRTIFESPVVKELAYRIDEIIKNHLTEEETYLEGVI